MVFDVSILVVQETVDIVKSGQVISSVADHEPWALGPVIRGIHHEIQVTKVENYETEKQNFFAALAKFILGFSFDCFL